MLGRFHLLVIARSALRGHRRLGTVRLLRSIRPALLSALGQLFVYRRVGRCRRPKDPTDIRHIGTVMLRDVATLPEPIPWATLLSDTS
jgi:hypothetical protein